MVRANRRITLEEIEDGLNEDCSHFSVHKIVSETLGYRRVSARWVDKWLKEAAGEWYNTGITKLVDRMKKVIEHQGDYLDIGFSPCYSKSLVPLQLQDHSVAHLDGFKPEGVGQDGFETSPIGILFGAFWGDTGQPSTEGQQRGGLENEGLEATLGVYYKTRCRKMENSPTRNLNDALKFRKLEMTTHMPLKTRNLGRRPAGDDIGPVQGSRSPLQRGPAEDIQTIYICAYVN
ncbi:hypothetical protein LAZ67_23000070 [Cordylochernes scorpioides]|uniref:Uncharacterized protein n=1 Tax=Cordylochernes scorpioides TaxID=51811 RepID=A0ABY6LSR3_9ARAC|nr:hypothetical protein LAZ67_23000070 [Cordylochernes scorpioides]